MEITSEQLFKGKSSLIKGKQYLSSQQYAEPFMNEMTKYTSNFIINAALPQQITNEQDVQDITWNKVWIQAVLPDEIEDHKEVISIIYALDVRKPLYKIYRGYLNQACMNLTVFNPQWINTFELKPGADLKYNIQNLLELESDLKIKLDTLKASFYDKSKITDTLGAWIDCVLKQEYSNGIHTVKLSPETVISGYKAMFMDESYKQKEISKFDMYNAFTSQITEDKKDIINKFEKTLIVNKLIEC